MLKWRKKKGGRAMRGKREMPRRRDPLRIALCAVLAVLTLSAAVLLLKRSVPRREGPAASPIFSEDAAQLPQRPPAPPAGEPDPPGGLAGAPGGGGGPDPFRDLPAGGLHAVLQPLHEPF